ncbi:MAG: fatty acid cis/trans isomerase [Sulfuricurvum sp.]|nr:fatty acid cis/trans isomerase [Sulfuricurvum sp.]
MIKYFIVLFICGYPLLGSEINYLREVKPILEHRCTVCHSCYNSPCQLKLDSFEGIDRGGSKKKVYLVTRLQAQDPTRLFIDAQTTEEWRKKEFFSVSDKLLDDENNSSITERLLDLKQKNPLPLGSYYPEAEDLTCAENAKEVTRYINKHPHGGMPFGFPPLSDTEHTTIMKWLAQGAKGPSIKEQSLLTEPSPAAAGQIKKWEAFFNGNGPKHVMSARYLYDHLFLAHIHFEGTPTNEFYEIVRSTTASPSPIAIIPTVRPYDDPGVKIFYYRFRKIHSTIVHKTHLVFPLENETLERYKELFIRSKWLQKPHVVPCDTQFNGNPFVMYAQIPSFSRYRFLLDHSQYIVDSFIRGPVCKGQIALNVIEDHFWMMFIDPEYDLGVKYPGFLRSQRYNLSLPTENGSGGKVWNVFSDEYRDRYEAFYKAKMVMYASEYPKGLPMDAIWKGDKAKDTPVLSIYRHFESASVHRGVLGELPKTMWVMDYPQLERMYYALVAGFDIFGNVTHQTNVRRYMDYLRIEGELNFLQFLPEKDRYPTLQSWYIGEEIENVRFHQVGSTLKTAVNYKSNDPKRELIERLVDNHFLPSTHISFDPYNYYRLEDIPPKVPKVFSSEKEILQAFRSLTSSKRGLTRVMNELQSDVLLVRIRNIEGKDIVVSMIINRWHDNVNALFNERSRLNPAKDTIDFFTENIGSYPNYFFDVEGADIGDFLNLMGHFDGSKSYKAKLNKYGINRSNPKFWETYEWFQNHFNEAEPVEAGLYDLNRYYHQAF